MTFVVLELNFSQMETVVVSGVNVEKLFSAHVQGGLTVCSGISEVQDSVEKQVSTGSSLVMERKLIK